MQITYRGVVLELRKLPDGSYEKPNVAQFTTAGRGCTWLDDCRMPYKSDDDEKSSVPGSLNSNQRNSSFGMGEGHIHRPEGRFPANLLVSDDVLNDGRVQKSGKAVKHNSGGQNFGGGVKPLADDIGYDDSGSYSRYFSLDAWVSKLPESVQKTFPFLIVPKASKSEKNAGLEDLYILSNNPPQGIIDEINSHLCPPASIELPTSETV